MADDIKAQPISGKEDSPYLQSLKATEQSLKDHIAKREQQLSNVPEASKPDYQQTILDEKARLAEVQKEIKKVS